uniref:Uncharacterized protein n=1 Tax=Branchiostoma floridae TaxID=7739 RepID=C3Y7P6_BRAFL|eukprot:XP_002607864.1 hypothetical protein BRAFLDRAFT_117275 [Branchiostoma floridae]
MPANVTVVFPEKHGTEEFLRRSGDLSSDGGKNAIFKRIWEPVNASRRVVLSDKGSADLPYGSRFSRYLNPSVFGGDSLCKRPMTSSGTVPAVEMHPLPRPATTGSGKVHYVNSLAPFSTLQKPTCGYYFSREIDQKKKCIGIPATNIVKWRS